MRLHWIKALSGLLALALLSGCTTDKDKLMPHGPQNMLDLWNQSSGVSSGSSASRQLMDARLQLRRPLSDGDTTHTSYTRTAQNEIYSQFKRLPNPDLVMYVFPHLAGTDPAPIPGYSTVFPLYQRVQYAMPGERTEDY
ncbi:TIGR03751 family conjugal transfer lipoprotein [Pseudomonas quasicaspiana]|uniref:TIGR03751 family conjugal transfer lipoprotein n=1 Tax=Pseudomonas quasicaspiana TaxID=2829821 RepID=UPI000F00CB05|nr:TIGR03751 family conjugal transfer lipoprotein [Pseudomonas quasicaspiana]MCD5976777.1 TIGR03751 family conjugal transfer lipoprotein [Pseudomonas quasicaspiana]